MPMFELERYIHVLSAIRKHNSFRAAAQELNISPSALSKQLNQLEGKYNVECVDRDTRTLTAYGDILVDEGGKGLAHFRNAFIQVENLRGIANKTVSWRSQQPCTFGSQSVHYLSFYFFLTYS